jgi:GTPase SAR1 family protein
MDGTLRCWEVGTWRCVAVVRIADSHHLVGGLAASPAYPLLARRTQDRERVEIYAIDTGRLLTATRPATTSYVNAKVVVVGDSGVGKSGLALVLTGRQYAPTDSTHGRQVWTFDEQTVDLPGGGQERRETLLWDLAGQPGYRLVHQLHLAEVAAALVVFDARSETEPFAGVRYWARALRQQGTMPAFLVAARTDRGGVPVSRDHIDALCADLGLAGYYETSARDGRQVPELAAALRAAVDWSALPRSVSTELFETIRLFLRAERDSARSLTTADDLYALFLRQHPGRGPDPTPRSGFDTCIRLLEQRDLVRRLSFGDFVLLRPELLDSYASALVDAARAQPDGLGYLAEDRALAGDFPVPAGDRPAGNAQRLLLIATVEELLRHDVALRETTDGGVNLVFPSQLTADRPEAPGSGDAEVLFRFDGAVRTVYAILVVRLAHVSAYRRERLWRNGVTYRALVGGVCELRVREVEEGRGELAVLFAEDPSEETRFLFEEYVRTHLETRALPGSVRRDRLFACPGCGYRLPADLVRRRQSRGDRDMPCPDCERVRISLLDRRDRLDRAAQVRAMNASADAGRDRAAATATIRGKEETRDYDVFLSYHSRDRAAVLAIAGRLRAAGVLPWVDQNALAAGDRWQEVLGKQIRQARTGAVLIGPHGVGRWQTMEVQALINESARRPLRIVPVFLPGTPPDADLPVFLGQWQAADLRTDDVAAFDDLLRAVTGARPGRD